MKSLEDCRLYGFVDTACLRGRDADEVARMLCEGGCDLIQLRAKTFSPDEVRRMAATMLNITESSCVGLVINDHPGIAVEIGAPLCHLGQEDFFDAGHVRVDELTQGKRLQIGLSTHAPTQAKRAVAAGAAYAAIGPVYATSTKPTARAVTLDFVRWAAREVTIPWFAIGGINLENVDEVLAAGARRICVVSAILNAPDIVQACQAFRNRLSSAPLR